MNNPVPHSRSASLPESAPAAGAVLASARLLQDAERGSEDSGLLLRGKNLGLVCESAGAVDALLFRSAALGLGAGVSHIRIDPSTPGAPAGAGLLGTARVLGRLYDGIECQGLAPAIVRELGRNTGVPVFDGLAGADHPSALLAQQLEGPGTVEQKRQLIVQAMLLIALR
jgi:ornithine carbamoyltransferase